jgi:hypothetical protein
VSGATLTPTDATKEIYIPTTTPGHALKWGSATIKSRLVHNAAAPSSNWSMNASLNAAGTLWVQDDSAKPSWVTAQNTTLDTWGVARCPAGVPASMTNLLTVDSLGRLIFGTRTPKARLIAQQTSDYAGLTFNQTLNTAETTWVQDDVTKASWILRMGGSPTDSLDVFRSGPGGAPGSPFLTLANNSDLTVMGNLYLAGSIGQKAAGTTWSNPSDPRLKDDIAPYAAGLTEILQLEPITYRLKAQPDGPLCYGFDASAVKDIFPECVSTMRMKLDPADEEETEDVLTFDMHPILVALVNTVKELAARVAALEGSPA